MSCVVHIIFIYLLIYFFTSYNVKLYDINKKIYVSSVNSKRYIFGFEYHFVLYNEEKMNSDFEYKYECEAFTVYPTYIETFYK